MIRKLKMAGARALVLLTAAIGGLLMLGIRLSSATAEAEPQAPEVPPSGEAPVAQPA